MKIPGPITNYWGYLSLGVAGVSFEPDQMTFELGWLSFRLDQTSFELSR